MSEAQSYKPIGWIVRGNVCDEYYRVEGAARSYAEIIGATVITVFERTAPTSAAGATKPNELTSSPEPAPALRAAEWVERAHRLVEEHETTSILYGDSKPGSLNESECQQRMHATRRTLRAHLSRASGLLPVAREGLSDEQLARIEAALEAGAIWAEHSEAHPRINSVLAEVRAYRQSVAVAPASGDAPGEAK